MRILKTREVLKASGLSRTTLWRYERAGSFPRRLKLGPNRVGWRADEVEAWIESRPRGLGAIPDAA